ncbi:TlpA disulfide reductase family protein [uncultured Draconibacterium sp.]|uniref:TlpA family protein disulfide reductase n=1 Tax=uncultured Draconibacterium sp. TaxID=1573823 RepID=UPI0029C874CC|nr:TlpA disulfide reductase family protein [uncultured Draconibacterium sp.]
MKIFINIFCFLLIVFIPHSQTQSIENNNNDQFKNELELLLNEPVINFSLRDNSGNIVKLKQFKNKILVLNFWDTSCAKCIRDIPYYNKLNWYYKNTSEIVFISICIDNVEKKQIWKELIQKHKFDGIQVFLPKNKKNKKENQFYKDNITSFPTSLLVSKSGKVLGALPDLNSIIATYVVENGFQDKSTVESVKEASIKNASYTKWFDINQFYINQFMMINMQLE